MADSSRVRDEREGRCARGNEPNSMIKFSSNERALRSGKLAFRKGEIFVMLFLSTLW